MHYEPRALWQVVGPLASNTRTRLDRFAFRNGQPYPYVLTHACIAPVGIPCRRGATGAALGYGANFGAMSQVTLRVLFPQRDMMHQIDLSTWGHSPCAIRSPLPATDRVSSSWMLGRWDFEYEARMRVGEAIAFEFTTFSRSVFTALNETTRPDLSMALYQRYPWMGARFATTRNSQSPVRQMLFNAGTWPNQNYGVSVDVAESNARPALSFPGSQFVRSNAGERSVAKLDSVITGFGIFIDQLAMDLSSADPTAVFGGLQNMMGMYARTSPDSKGVGRAWWDGYAPISLVTPSINDNAIVYRLPEPIRLERNKAMDIQVVTPTGVVIDDIDPHWNVGVSFLGYAEIPESSIDGRRSAARSLQA